MTNLSVKGISNSRRKSSQPASRPTPNLDILSLLLFLFLRYSYQVEDWLYSYSLLLGYLLLWQGTTWKMQFGSRNKFSQDPKMRFWPEQLLPLEWSPVCFFSFTFSMGVSCVKYFASFFVRIFHLLKKQNGPSSLPEKMRFFFSKISACFEK